MNAAMPVCLALSAAAAIAVSPIPDRLALVPNEIVIGFDEPDAAKDWITVNDNVMGGRSVGGVTVQEGRLVFEGATNTNGGGFSSIRTRTDNLDLDGTDGMLYRVKGDGRTYIAALRNGARAGRFDISYWAEFDTTGEWQTVRIPFDAFVPTFMGQDITGRAPALRAEDAEGAAFYIYDKKDGPFRLEIEWIGTYRADDQETEGGAMPSEHAASPATHGDRASPPSPSAESIRTWATAVLSGAIERGVPRFNAGDPGACADLYEIAIASLITSPAPLPEDARALLASGLRSGQAAQSHEDRAWAYRYAMDAALERLMPRMVHSPDRSARAD